MEISKKRSMLNRLSPYLMSFTAVLVCVFPLFKFEYSTDTYHFALHEGVNGICGAMWENGRLVIHDFTKLFRPLSLGIVPYYYFSFIMSIIFATLSIVTVYKMLKGHMSDKIAYFLSVITIFNPMVFELFLFIEKGFFMLAIYMSVLACKFFLKFLQGKRVYLLLSYPLLVVSCFTYQPMPGVFVALCLVFIIAYSNSFLQLAANTGVAVTVYGVPTLLNFIIMRQLDLSTRLSNGLNLTNIYKYLTFGLYKPLFLLVYVAIFSILFFVVFYSFKSKTGKAFTKDSGKVFFIYSFLLIGTIITTAAPTIATTPENVFFTLRFSYPIGMLVGTIPILYNFKTSYRIEENEKELSKKSLCIIIIVLSLFMIIFHSFFFSRLITNSKDREDAMKIGEIISDYEEKTGIEIKYISLYRDKNSSNTFKGTASLPNCNVRAIVTKWCDIPHLNLFLERDFQKIEPLNEYVGYFSNKDWNSVDREQFIFDGNTLHLCIY